MSRETRMYGIRGKRYGIWNTLKKEFQFGICEDTPLLAEARLAQHIGDDARKWRFEAKELPKELAEKYGQTINTAEIIMLQQKDREIKALKARIRQLEAAASNTGASLTPDANFC